MLYRPFTLDDFDQLYAIEESCFEPPFRFDRDYMRQLVSRKNAATWIAEENGHLLGFAIVHWSKRSRRFAAESSPSPDNKNELAAYIETIEVLQQARSQGAGSQLLCRIEDAARLAGAALIWLHVEAANTAAIRLYEAQGYFCEGRRENYYPMGRAALIYVKRLNANPDTVNRAVELN
ncbi:MAG: N-acetyltransferase [Terracidiphilus sp.]